MGVNLSEEQIGTIRQILAESIDIETQYSVFVFGSRVRGDNQTYSDVDLGIEANDGGKLPFDTLLQIKSALSDSNLPFIVDVVDFNNTDPDWKDKVTDRYYISGRTK